MKIIATKKEADILKHCCYMEYCDSCMLQHVCSMKEERGSIADLITVEEQEEKKAV